MGAAGMLARIVFSAKESMTFKTKLLHMAAAGIVAVIVGYSLNDIIESESAKMAILGMTGCAAPEMVKLMAEQAVNFFKKFSR